MCTPALASLSAASAAVTLVVFSLAVAPPARSQDSSLPPASGSYIDATGLRGGESALLGYEANLKVALKRTISNPSRSHSIESGHSISRIETRLKLSSISQRVLSIVRKLGEQTAEATALSDIGAADFRPGP